MCFIANMQDICNLIDREEYNVGRIVISVTILHSDQKKKKKNSITSDFRGIKNKVIINYQLNFFKKFN